VSEYRGFLETYFEGILVARLWKSRAMVLLMLCSLFCFPLSSINHMSFGDKLGLQTDGSETTTSSDFSYLSAFSDTELAALVLSEGWTGNGSEASPYLIDGLVNTHANSCVNFQNISHHFVFKNCTLETVSITEPIAKFVNVSNGHLENSTLAANDLQPGYDCILIEESPDFVIQNCSIFGSMDLSFYDPNQNTISIVSSPNCIISNCQLYRCYLRLQGSSVDSYLHNISEVTVDDAPVVYISSSNDIILTSVNFGQLIIVDCLNVSLYDSIVNTSARGIQLYYSEGCIIQNNTILNSDYHSILIVQCESCVIKENIFPTYFGYRIVLQQSTSCKIVGNNFTNTYSGISVTESTLCEISTNYFSNSYGIYCYNVSLCNLTENYVEFSSFGIRIVLSQDCYLSGNQAIFCDSTMRCDNSRNITIIGDTYQGASFFPATPAHILDSSDIWIESCSFIGDEAAGIFLKRVQNFTFCSNDDIYGWSSADLRNCRYGRICNTTFVQSLRVWDSRYITIENNIFNDCTLSINGGLHISTLNSDFPQGDIYIGRSSNCSFENVSIDGSGIKSDDSDWLEISNSSIQRCNTNGVRLTESSFSRIENCNISDNSGDGIRMINSSNNTVTDNFISGNTRMGIEIRSGSNNSIYGNLFLNNAISNAYDNGTFNHFDDGISVGNGWSDYLADGFYHIDGTAGSIDHFPWNPIPPQTTPTATSNQTLPDSLWSGELIVISVSSLMVILVAVVLIKKEQSE